MPGLRDIDLDERCVELATRGDEPLRIYYKPGAVTPRQVHQQQRWAGVKVEDLPEAEQREAMDATGRTLAGLITRWNLDGADGRPLPPTLEGLEDVTYAHQRLFLDAILADARTPKSAAAPGASPTPAAPVAGGTVNSAASSTPAPSAPPLATSSPSFPTGTPTTPSPNGSVSASSSFPTFPTSGLPAPA